MAAEALDIRMAGRADLAALDSLYGRAFPRLLKADYPPSILVTAVPRLSRAQPRLLASGRFYVAAGEGGAILGAGGYSLSRDADGRALAEIRHLATDPDATRRGVARALLGRILAEARREGLTRARALSTRTAVPFYRAMGFERGPAVEITLGPAITFPAVEMRRAL